MNTIELKNNFHKLIDSIENDNILLDFYELINKTISAKPGRLWNKLQKYEQDDLLKTLEESMDIDNTISQEKMREKHRKWL